MTFATLFSEPYYEGGGTTTLVPFPWDCAINGRTFMFDWKYAAGSGIMRQGEFTRESIPLLKPQQDTSGPIGENSLNPAEFARRAQESWHLGAGQSVLDRDDSQSARFNTSKGVDPWTKWQLSLLPDTTNRRSTSGTNLYLTTAGDYLYVSDGQEVYWTQDVTVAPTWTSAVIFNGESAQSVKSICSDGYTVYAALGSNGVHKSTRGAASSSHYSDLSCTLVRYVKGRLMAANGAAIYNVIAAGAAPSALFTHANTDFTWVDFAEGAGAIYAGGFSGDKSLVYRTAVVTDGTTLAAPVIAGELPDGEILRSMQGYLGQYLMLGTDKGVRFCGIDSNNNLVMGSLIPTDNPVRCFEPQDKFVWYGLENYDSSSTGLGRLNLEFFTNTLTPAYASDLTATTQGAVQSIATFQDIRVFTVSGLGVYAETTNKVASGTLDSGLITYDQPDAKVAMYLTVNHAALAGSISVAVSTDGGTFVTVGTNSTANTTTFTVPVGQLRGEKFEVRTTLTRDAVTTTGPEVTRYTLEASPAPGRGEFFTVPLLLFEKVDLANGREAVMDVGAEYAALTELIASATPTQYTDGLGTETTILDDGELIVEKYTAKRDAFQGTYLAKLRRPRRRT